MRKSWLILLAVFLLVGAFAAHVAAQDGGEPSGVVRVGTWDSGDGLVPWNDAIAAFEAEHPNIDIQLEAVPQEYGTRLLAQFASGDAPDIFMTGDGDTAKFQALGAIEPLTPYITGESGIDTEIFFPAVLEFGQVGDELYYMTKDYSPLVLFYNVDHFEEAGVELPAEGWTWDDFVSAAQQLTIDANGNNATSPDFDPNNIQRWGIQLTNSWGDFYWLRGMLPIIYSHGGSVVSEDGTTATGYMNSPETVAAIENYMALFNDLNVAIDRDEFAAFAGTDLFQSGLVSMLWTGRWPISDFQSNPDLNFGTVGLPAGPEGNANVLCWSGFAMYSGSENKDAACEFLKYISAEEGAAEFGEYALSAVESVVDELGLSEDPLNAPIIADLENVQPLPEAANPFWAECGNTFFVQQLERVFLEGVSVQEAMDTAAEQTDTCLAEAAE